MTSNAVFVPVDHIILNFGRKLDEISAEPADPNNQVPVLVRMDFSIAQFHRINHVVLNVGATVLHKGVGIGD